ncbi:hypothetical protein ABEY13_06390 [Bacillus velezensis]|uniref:hypothetical protein n=1 Tax=Bacillus velezensis TaxID=492670 RepID=UPI002DB8AF0A|nr:hypothetical protein [Bacillus velezensis]MEC3659225.1 hypothetical protein [Bacillus velezensis]MEC3685463.1 hypothetical protein [Bacillus velezensis]MEC3788413.1 hypothetical protein [Bacillus velezensis]MEC3848670.1 hypothetical protein [Bacillus velezensis]
MIELKGSRIHRKDSKPHDAECKCVEPTPNLLTIELTDEQSVPRIIYKGEEITNRIAVDFEWRTKDADQCGSTYYRIKHTKDIAGAPVVETKELAVGERAYGA